MDFLTREPLRGFWLRGDNCDAVFERRSSDVLLVTFDNLASIDERPETRPWPAWLAQRAETLNYSILGIQAHQKDWYRSPEPPDWINGLMASGFFEAFKQVVFIGASMGAFAALCYGGLVPGARVLAFSPQSTLNRTIAPFEERYPYPYRKFDWEAKAYLDAADYVGAISSGYLFFDPQVPEDKRHAERLIAPGLQQVKLAYSGHTLIRALVKSGAFDHMLATFPQTGRLDTRFFQLLRGKRENPKWAKPFLKDVRDRRGDRAVKACAEILWRDHKLPFGRRVLSEMKEAKES